MNARDALQAQLADLADDPSQRPDHATALGPCTALLDYGPDSTFESPDGFRAEPVALTDLGNGTFRVSCLVVGTGQVGHGDVVTVSRLAADQRHRDGLVGQVSGIVTRADVARGRVVTTDTAAVAEVLAALDGVLVQTLGAAGWVMVQCPHQQVGAVERAVAAAGLQPHPRVRWYG